MSIVGLKSKVLRKLGMHKSSSNELDWTEDQLALKAHYARLAPLQISSPAMDEELEVFNTYEACVDALFIAMQNRNSRYDSSYSNAVRKAVFLKDSGSLYKFMTFSKLEQIEIMKTCEGLNYSLLDGYVFALHTAGSMNELIMSKNTATLFANSELPFSDGNDVSKRKAYLQKKCSANFRNEAELFAESPVMRSDPRSDDIVFTVACLTAIAYSENTVIKLMSRWDSDNCEDSLVNFVKIAANYEGLEDYPLEWVLQLASKDDLIEATTKEKDRD